MKKKLIIAGGGTGGHVNAGLAVAEEWKKKFGEDAEILFVGAVGGIEETLVPKANYRLETLKIKKIKGKSIISQFYSLIFLPFAFLRALYILKKEAPCAVLGVGGYASGPLLVTAFYYRIFRSFHLALLEQNAVMGLTNRLLSQKVEKIFTTFDLSKELVGKKTIITGNPIRTQFVRTEYKKPSGKFNLFIFGGSLGAKGLNILFLEALNSLEDLKNQIQIVHQTGKIDFERINTAYQEKTFQVRVEPFIYDMKSEYENASLVICRSGSSSLFELAAVGRPAVLVPLPSSADDHQYLNAKVYENAQASWVIKEGEGQGEKLANLIRELMSNPQKLVEASERLRPFDRKDAAKQIVLNLS